MKLQRTVTYVLLSMLLVSLVLVVVYSDNQKSPIILNLSISTLSGSIIGLVTSLSLYFYERNKLLNTLRTNISLVCTDLIIHKSYLIHLIDKDRLFYDSKILLCGEHALQHIKTLQEEYYFHFLRFDSFRSNSKASVQVRHFIAMLPSFLNKIEKDKAYYDRSFISFSIDYLRAYNKPFIFNTPDADFEHELLKDKYLDMINNYPRMLCNISELLDYLNNVSIKLDECYPHEMNWKDIQNNHRAMFKRLLKEIVS